MNTPLTREQVLRLHAKAIALMESPPMGEQERRAADAVKCMQQIEDFLSAWRLQRETAPLFYEWYIAKVQVYRCSQCSRLARRDRSHECLGPEKGGA